MTKQLLKLALSTVITAFLFISCASKKEMVYLQGEQALTNIYEKSTPKIRPNDMLTINVSAADMKATEPFNLANVYQVRNTNNYSAQNVYTVSEDGSIDFPVIGKVQVGGLTRNEAITLFKNKLNQFIVNPGVNINFENFKVSVIGEVAKPGTFTLPNERITLLEALALAGDLTIQGKRQNVMVIREANGAVKTFTVDLTSKEVINSPVYYLAQNDVVYVEPNKSKMQSSVVNYTIFVSLAGIIISVISVLAK